MMDLPGKAEVHRDWFGLAGFRPGPNLQENWYR